MSGRRADDFQTIVVRSGRRASDVMRTFGEIPAQKEGCFTQFFKGVGYFILIGLVLLFLFGCCSASWMASLFS